MATRLRSVAMRSLVDKLKVVADRMRGSVADLPKALQRGPRSQRLTSPDFAGMMEERRIVHEKRRKACDRVSHVGTTVGLGFIVFIVSDVFGALPKEPKKQKV